MVENGKRTTFVLVEKRHLLIGITGGSGSGKTSFIQELKKTYSKKEVCIISQDDYYLPRDQQQIDRQGIANFDRPKSIDKKAFHQDILRLLHGEPVQRLEYTFNNDLQEARTLEFLPAPVIIVEGLFVLHFTKIRKLLDLSIFLHAKDNLKVIRRIRRDQVERNYPLDDVLYRYQHHVLPTFEKFIKPYIDDCDVIINNNRKFDVGLDVIRRYIRHWLDDGHLHPDSQPNDNT
ncbi:MAG: uridine kinase [Saprospiraceae bacterium]|nr:uridine kinase [Saprospiraceae bacterium]